MTETTRSHRVGGEPRDPNRQRHGPDAAHLDDESNELDRCVEGIIERWSDAELYRMITKNIARRFHASTAEERAQILNGRASITHTRWDALLAATVEHVAHTHGHGAPDWVDEPERFNREPVRFGQEQTGTENCPAAFVRHGALIDPRTLDRRGGENEEWEDH